MRDGEILTFSWGRGKRKDLFYSSLFTIFLVIFKLKDGRMFWNSFKNRTIHSFPCPFRLDERAGALLHF